MILAKPKSLERRFFEPAIIVTLRVCEASKKVLIMSDKTITKLKKIHKVLDKIYQLPYDEKDFILDIILKYCRTQIKKNNKTSLPKNDNEPLDRIYEKIIFEINSLGKPFTKMNIKSKDTKIYKRTLRYVKKYYKKYRYEMVDIFRLGYKYFKDPYFIYRPKEITLSDFFRYRNVVLQYSPGLSNLTKSWFKEFAKGENHIKNKFLRKAKDNHPDLTNEFINIWQETKRTELTIFDINSIIIFVSKSYIFAQKNRLSTRTIFDVVKMWLIDDKQSGFISGPRYLTTEYFWTKQIQQILLNANIFKSRRDIK